VDFGGWEEAVAGLVGPVERDGCGEGDEEGVEGDEGLVGAESVAEAGPVRIISLGVNDKETYRHTMVGDQSSMDVR
jgi:hypothetical protein